MPKPHKDQLSSNTFPVLPSLNSLFIFYLPRYILQDFPPISSQAPCHSCLVVIEQRQPSQQRAHTENFSESYYIKPKSDCIYHFPIDLEPNGPCLLAVPNESENGIYNLISVWFNKIPKSFPCVWYKSPSILRSPIEKSQFVGALLKALNEAL